VTDRVEISISEFGIHRAVDSDSSGFGIFVAMAVGGWKDHPNRGCVVLGGQE